MILAVRRGLAGAAVGVIVLLGAAGISPASADTASPSPTTATATAKATATGTAKATANAKATATPTTQTGTGTDAADTAPDNSRQAWALGGAGALALLAAAVVFFRRR